MNRVSMGRHCCAQSTHLESFRGMIADEMLEQVQALARGLKGVRICNINSTAGGGLRRGRGDDRSYCPWNTPG